MVPDALKKLRRKRLAASDWTRLMAAWTAVRSTALAFPSPAPAPDPTPGRLLFLPSDLGQITGALGDDAMITATLEQAEARLGPVAVEMIGHPAARRIVEAKGFDFVPLSRPYELPATLATCFAVHRYAAVVILGADILDGYYNPTAALTRLVCADLAARAGAPVTVLGCSFNKTPALGLRAAFDQMHKDVQLHMRDEISLGRLHAFCNAPGRLVADCAFTLNPAPPDATAAAWIAGERAIGRNVLGLNVHPMLIRNASAREVDQIIAASAEAVALASADHSVSWVLIPHDYRGDRGDARCLQPIHAALVLNGVHSFYLEGTHRAAALKGLAGLCDGVVTGRMHLAIAALGMGVPTLSLTYQDKFEGLYRHFGLPDTFLVAPETFGDVKSLATSLDGFISGLPALTATVAERLPEVKRLAGINFDVMGSLPEA